MPDNSLPQSFTALSEQSPQTILLISDRENMHHLKTSLQYHNCQVQCELIDDFSNSTLRNEIIDRLRLSPPQVLWFHAPNWELKLKLEDQRRVAICFAIMMHTQLQDTSRHLIVEGNLHHF